MAFSGEFITHGGFEIVRDAWLFVSNIMHSSAYQTCIMLFFIGSFVFAALAGTFRGFMRFGMADPSWLTTMFVVIAIYAGFFGVGIGHHWRLTGQLAIYDDVKNKNEVIGDLPPGLVALVSSVNGIQVKLEELVEQAITSPAFGNLSEAVMSVKMLRDASYGQLYNTAYVMVPGEVKDSIWKFYVDVLSPVLMANPWLRQEVEGHSPSLLESMGKGAHPALYTTTWLDPSGNPMDHTETVTGAEAWRRIKNFFTKSTVWQEIVSKYCSYFYFDTANPQSVSACRNIFKNAIGYFLGLPGKTSEDMAQNVILGALWRKYVAQLTGESHPFRGAGAFSGANPPSITTSTGIVLEQWLPTAKVVVTVFVIGLTPIIMLFFVTTFSFRAVTALFGLYLWLLLWAVADKIAEGFWVNYAYSVMQTLDFSKGGAGVSITGLDLMGINASQVLAVLGGMRGVGMSLAGVLSYGILGFGGHVFARLLGSIEASLTEAKSLSGQKIMAESIHPSSTAQASLWESHVKQVGMAIPMEAVSSVAYYMSGYKKVFDTYSGGAYKGFGPADAHISVTDPLTKAWSSFETRESVRQALGASPVQAQQVLNHVPFGSIKGLLSSSESVQSIGSNIFGLSTMKGYLKSGSERERFAKLQNLRSFLSGLYLKEGMPGNSAVYAGTIDKKGVLFIADFLTSTGFYKEGMALREWGMKLKEGERVSATLIGAPWGLAGYTFKTEHGASIAENFSNKRSVFLEKATVKLGDKEIGLENVFYTFDNNRVTIMGTDEKGFREVISFNASEESFRIFGTDKQQHVVIEGPEHGYDRQISDKAVSFKVGPEVSRALNILASYGAFKLWWDEAKDSPSKIMEMGRIITIGFKTYVSGSYGKQLTGVARGSLSGSGSFGPLMNMIASKLGKKPADVQKLVQEQLEKNRKPIIGLQGGIVSDLKYSDALSIDKVGALVGAILFSDAAPMQKYEALKTMEDYLRGRMKEVVTPDKAKNIKDEKDIEEIMNPSYGRTLKHGDLWAHAAGGMLLSVAMNHAPEIARMIGETWKGAKKILGRVGEKAGSAARTVGSKAAEAAKTVAETFRGGSEVFEGASTVLEGASGSSVAAAGLLAGGMLATGFSLLALPFVKDEKWWQEKEELISSAIKEQFDNVTGKNNPAWINNAQEWLKNSLKSIYKKVFGDDKQLDEEKLNATTQIVQDLWKEKQKEIAKVLNDSSLTDTEKNQQVQEILQDFFREEREKYYQGQKGEEIATEPNRPETGYIGSGDLSSQSRGLNLNVERADKEPSSTEDSLHLQSIRKKTGVGEVNLNDNRAAAVKYSSDGNVLNTIIEPASSELSPNFQLTYLPEKELAEKIMFTTRTLSSSDKKRIQILQSISPDSEKPGPLVDLVASKLNKDPADVWKLYQEQLKGKENASVVDKMKALVETVQTSGVAPKQQYEALKTIQNYLTEKIHLSLEK